jgi:hypothetical protein
MLELNPQLQSKVFDSLLLHMRAERQEATAADAPPARGSGDRVPGARQGRAPKGRTAKAGRPRADGESRHPAWEGLASDLRRLGLDKNTADGLVSWASAQAEQSRQSPVKIRMLHPMEREFISVDAYDYLLELYRLGLLDPGSMETLLENCAFVTSLPASKEQVQKMALRSFSEALEAAGLGQSH